MNASDHLRAIIRSYDPHSDAIIMSEERLDATHRAIAEADAWLRAKRRPKFAPWGKAEAFAQELRDAGAGVVVALADQVPPGVTACADRYKAAGEATP